jgi:hypothetical protein
MFGKPSVAASVGKLSVGVSVGKVSVAASDATSAG